MSAVEKQSYTTPSSTERFNVKWHILRFESGHEIGAWAVVDSDLSRVARHLTFGGAHRCLRALRDGTVTVDDFNWREVVS